MLAEKTMEMAIVCDTKCVSSYRCWCNVGLIIVALFYLDFVNVTSRRLKKRVLWYHS